MKHPVLALLGAFAFCVSLNGGAVAQTSTPHASEQHNQQRSASGRQQRNPQRAPSPEQNLTAAQAALTALNASCTATEAKLLGETADKNLVYEVVCSSGPGYIVQASTPPSGEDCLLLDSAAKMARERDPAATGGSLCTLPANQNLNAILADYAARAGVPCAVNEGLAIGKGADGAIFYEVGCDGADGYRLTRKGDTFTKVSCLQLSSQNYTCRFSTKAEQIADVQKLLAGTEASACGPTDLRYMGGNANGEFVEIKCTEAGQGFIARVKDGLAQQVYPCATAQRIGDGCKLTPAPAAAAPAPAGGRP